jgi:hypothetical protein
MEEIRAQSGQTGLVGGAAQRQRRTASRVGTQEQRGLIQQRETGMQSVQENIGNKLGQLEGTLLDFLGSQAQMALNIKSFDPPDENVETSNATQGSGIDTFNYNDFLERLNANIYDINIGGQYGG